VETINQLKMNRDFFLGFAKNPQEFINSWLVSQTRDLKACFQLPYFTYFLYFDYNFV